MSSLAFSWRRVPWATLLLAVVIAAVHAVGQHHEGFSVEFVGRSVVVPDLRWSEPHRMVAANFFHDSNLHLANNLSGLLLTGWLIESALGRAVVLNIALWGGMLGMYNGLRLNQDHGLTTGLGASAMVYALGGAFLTWRALRPALFGPLGRNSLLWVVLLLYAVFALAGDPPAVTPFHLGGFVYGVASGLLGLRLSPPWRLRFAVLALGLCLASATVIGVRALRQEPFETTEAMRVLLDGPHPKDYVNRISWYWATQPDAPRAVLGIARERMKDVVAEKASWDYQDTLATLYYRLGDLGRAVELERAALESKLPPEKIAFLVSQLARFEYAWLSHEDAASLGRTPLRLRLIGDGVWQLEPPTALPRRALVLSGERLVGYLELAAESDGEPVRMPAPREAAGPAAADLAVMPLPVGAGAPARPTRLFWMDPEVMRLP